MANLVLADDHILLRKGLAGLVNNFGYTILFEAECNTKKNYHPVMNGNLLNNYDLLL